MLRVSRHGSLSIKQAPNTFLLTVQYSDSTEGSAPQAGVLRQEEEGEEQGVCVWGGPQLTQRSLSRGSTQLSPKLLQSREIFGL